MRRTTTSGSGEPSAPEGDPDLERGQPPLDLAPLRFEGGPSPLQRRPQVGAAAHQLADLGQAHAHVAQGQDPAQLRQLGRRSSSGSRPRIDPGRGEQAGRVVGAQDLGRDAGEGREPADGEHGSTYHDSGLTFPSGEGS